MVFIIKDVHDSEQITLIDDSLELFLINVYKEFYWQTTNDSAIDNLTPIYESANYSKQRLENEKKPSSRNPLLLFLFGLSTTKLDKINCEWGFF